MASRYPHMEAPYSVIASSTRCVLVVLWAVFALGCNRGRDTEKILQDAAISYERLTPALNGVRRALSDLQRGADDLAGRVPRGAEWRGKVHGLDEVTGVLDAKIKWWLPEQLAAARTAGQKDQAIKVRDEVALAARELDQATKMAVDLTHEKSRLERLSSLFAPIPGASAEQPDSGKRSRP